MARLSPLICFGLLLSIFLINAPLNAQKSARPEVFRIHRGVNISHWLSQSRARGADRQAYFTEADVAAVAEAGFDHIRIPIDEEQMWDEAGNKIPEAWQLLHAALGWMKKHRLKALVDLTSSAPTISWMTTHPCSRIRPSNANLPTSGCSCRMS